MRKNAAKLTTLTACAVAALMCLGAVASTAGNTKLTLTWTPKQSAYYRGSVLHLVATLKDSTGTPIAGVPVEFRTYCDQLPNARLIHNPKPTNAAGQLLGDWTVPTDANQDNNYLLAKFRGDKARGLDACATTPVRIPIGPPR